MVFINNILLIFYSKWKPGVTPVTSTSVYQLIRVESLSLYLNPNGSSSLPFYPKIWDFTNLLAWKAVMHRSLRTFAINSEEFQFRKLKIKYILKINILIINFFKINF